MNGLLTDLWLRAEKILHESAARAGVSQLATQLDIARKLGLAISESEAEFEKIGILGAAFLFGESSGDGWSLFERRNRHPNAADELALALEAVTSVSTPYIVRLREGSHLTPQHVKRLIHGLFLDVRAIQELGARSANTMPEFFSWLPQHGRQTPFEWEKTLRDSLGVHYVGHGELLAALIAWRTLHANIRGGGNGTALRPARGAPAGPQPRHWLGSTIACLNEEPTAAIAKVLARPAENWLSECRSLLANPNDEEALVRFAHRIGVAFEGVSSTEDGFGDLAATYVRLLCGTDHPNLGAHLAAFEASSRAPLPAYYYWQLAEGRGRAHLVLPVWTSALNPLRLRDDDDSTTAVQPSVGLALAAVDPLPELERSLDTTAPIAFSDSRQFLEIANILRQISRPLVEFVFYEPVKQREKAAQANQLVAAIMSRNLSHNIGSHVLFHLREELETGLQRDKRVADLIKYLQARMDFIALISSEGATWPGVVSLNHLRAPFSDPGSMLLKHIVKSQRVSPPSIRVRAKDEVEGKESNLDFAIPTGSVGTHAVYSIIENFLRNSAKYGLDGPDTSLDISLEVSSDGNDEKFWTCTLQDNNRSMIESARQVAQAFDEPLFDHSDPGRSHRNWGLKEIKIASLFLVGGVDAIRAQYDPTLAAVTGPQPAWLIDPLDERTCRLKFKFHLMRPLGLCLVGKSAATEFEDNPLMRVFATASEILEQDVEAGRRYELIVTDAETIEGLSETGHLLQFRRRGMRMTYVGRKPTCKEVANDVDFVPVGESWADLRALTSEKTKRPWQLIGEKWVEQRWPGRRTVFASPKPEKVPEFVQLVDEVRGEFEQLPMDSDVQNMLVWDHTSYRDAARMPTTPGQGPTFESFGFHRPVSHPFTVALGPDDGAWRLKEAACLQIGIIDERVWGSRLKAAKDQGYNKLPPPFNMLSSAWRRAGVHIMNQHAVNFWRAPEVLDRHPLLDGRADIPPLKGPLDFLVVHRSLIDQTATASLEQMTSPFQQAPGSREQVVGEIMAWLRLAAHRLIVTSGRGLEPAYREVLNSTGSGFVEFSALADAIFDNTGDKVGIVRLLRSV